MLRVEAAPVPQHCPRCRGPLFKGDDDDYGCLLCGERIYPQPRIIIERLPLDQQGPRKRGRPRKQRLVA
jgi:uncharacterized Zn finger protein (UPF0148 family)